MKQHDLDKYLNDPISLHNKIEEFLKDKTIKIQTQNADEVHGHIQKSEHNLGFVRDNIKLRYFDWAITGCYYASYHAALALILTKNYSSKNHLATLLILIREFYNNGLEREDIEMLANLLDYQDILFYVESKNKREDATYSTQTKYTITEVEQLRVKSILFVSKIKTILQIT